MATGLDLVNHPDLVNDPKRFLECGVADFVNCGCLPYARADDVLGVTRRLNGGTVGLNERRAWLAKWKAADVAVPTPGARPNITLQQAGPVVASTDPPEPAPPSITNPSKGSIGAVIANLLAAIFKRK